MRNKHISIALMCAALAALMLACAGGSTNTSNGGGTANTGAAGGGGGGKKRLAFVTNNPSDFWTIARKGTEKAAAELGNVDVEFRMPGEGSAAEQKRLVDDLLAKGIDGMAISPVDPANQTQMINDAAGKILVLTQDSDAPTSNRACYIGTDNKAAGRQAGELIKEALPGGGKIMIFVGKSDAQNARERYEGLKEAIAGSNIEIIDVRTDDADRVRAKANAADTLVKYPDVAALVGLWAYNAPAILSAVRDAGKIGQVKIIAFDEEDDTLKGIKEGAVVGTVVQQPFEFGYQSIKAMAQILGGDRSVIPAGKQVFVPTKVIKKDTVEEFTRQLNQLRGRG
ncbi:MAG TPA: sugar-binding protein [Pyrinomonadaceae bacterium]|jgi:ribose transport system substrate-binding protein|nr:sugar-binding protein [Pyrinomonadaceae bacterium]